MSQGSPNLNFKKLAGSLRFGKPQTKPQQTQIAAELEMKDKFQFNFYSSPAVSPACF